MVEYVSERIYLCKKNRSAANVQWQEQQSEQLFCQSARFGALPSFRKGVAERLCNARSTFGNLVCLASSVTVYFTMITKYLLTLQNSWGLLIRSTYWF